jgi:hypothetical protein
MSKRNPANNVNNNKNQINIVIKNELPKSKSVRKPKVEPKVALLEKEQDTQLPSGRFINPSSRQIRYVDTNDRTRPILNLSTITGTAGSDSFNVQGENRQRDNVMTNPRVEAVEAVEAVESQPNQNSNKTKYKSKFQRESEKDIKVQAEKMKQDLEEMELEDLIRFYETSLGKKAGRKKKENIINELVKDYIKKEKENLEDFIKSETQDYYQDENSDEENRVLGLNPLSAGGASQSFPDD